MCEAVGEVTDRPALSIELLLEVGPLGAGLDSRKPRRLVYGNDLSQTSEVERDDNALLCGHRLKAARDVAAATERNDDRVGGNSRIHDRLHFSFIGWVDDNVRAAFDRIAADAHEVAQALAVGVNDAHHVVASDVVFANDAGQLFDEGCRGFALRHVQIIKRRLASASGRTKVETDRVLHEGSESGLVLVVESHTLVAPAPPLHVFDSSHLIPFGDERGIG